MNKTIKTVLFTLILLTAGFSYSCGQVKCGKTNNPKTAEEVSAEESPGDAGFSSGTMTEIEASDPGTGTAAEKAAPEKRTEEKNADKETANIETGKDTGAANPQGQTAAAFGRKTEKQKSASPEAESGRNAEPESASASDAEGRKARTDMPASSAETEKRSGLININTASREELMKLKGVGEIKALRILEYRESHGGFKSIEEIMKVRGIKDGSFQKIRDSITV